MKDSIDRTIGVVDESFTVIACSDLGRIGEAHNISSNDMSGSAGVFVRGSITYKPFGTPQRPEYIVFVEGADMQATRYASLLAVSLYQVKQYYDEKYDRSNFVKNIITDNILPGDVYAKARELRFDIDIPRVALVIRVMTKNDISVYDIIQNLFPEKHKDFVINISESDIVLIKETKAETSQKDLDNLAKSIADTLSSEFYTHTYVGIGTKVNDIKDLPRSFKEAQIALEVGKVFDTEKNIVNYDQLGIARLIYQLPTTLCQTYLSEVFKRGAIESLDQETLFTIQRFFENNLNVSETSRKLFVHRNTLVYRLEKIRKLTGLDLREFDHAIVFKIALMVKKYLTSDPIKF